MNDELEQFDAALREQGAELSDAGAQRRESMRALVVSAAKPQSQSGYRWGALVAAAAIVLSLLWAVLRTDRDPVQAPEVAQHMPSPEGMPEPAAETFAHMVVTTLGDDLAVLDRYRFDETKASQVVLVGDLELISLLAQAGHQTGIIRIGEAVELTTPLLESESAGAGAAE